MFRFLGASIRVVAVAITFGGAVFSQTANAKPHTLPEPYMSKALEALVMPVDPSVRSLFKLGPKETGMLVLAVKPRGTAARQGILPGDVIGHVKGRGIKKPSELDAIFYYFLKKGSTGFPIAYNRGGKPAMNHYRLDLRQYQTVQDPGSVGSWTSSSSFTSFFNFQQFVTEFTIELAASYLNSQTQIDQMVSSQEFSSGFDAANLDTDNDGIPDSVDTDDDNDGVPDARDHDEDGDGVLDAEELQDNDGNIHETDSEEARDTDHDGTPDAYDNDDDGDGVPDAQDADEDGDGVADTDELHNESEATLDTDHDGVDDAHDNDDDNDGVADSQDADEDGDGVDDVEEIHDHQE
jgi:hypothetical protein